LGLLLLRVPLGAFFIAHGINKFQNMAAMETFFASLGFGPFWPKLVAVTELFSGVAILSGAFLWVAAPLITIVMAVAIWKVTASAPGPLLTNFISGWGPNVIYAVAALALAFIGAGRWSLTAWWLRRKGMDQSCKDCRADHGMGHNCPACPGEHK
jgi:putative oxidoreductase